MGLMPREGYDRQVAGIYKKAALPGQVLPTANMGINIMVKTWREFFMKMESIVQKLKNGDIEALKLVYELFYKQVFRTKVAKFVKTFFWLSLRWIFLLS